MRARLPSSPGRCAPSWEDVLLRQGPWLVSRVGCEGRWLGPSPPPPAFGAEEGQGHRVETELEDFPAPAGESLGQS